MHGMVSKKVHRGGIALIVRTGYGTTFVRKTLKAH